MFARRVIPLLLIGGAVMMLVQHKRLELMGACEEGEPRHPIGLRSPHGQRGEWGKRVPPMFDMWHKRAHEQEQAAQQPATV
jgi:hypothetical protein